MLLSWQKIHHYSCLTLLNHLLPALSWYSQSGRQRGARCSPGLLSNEWSVQHPSQQSSSVYYIPWAGPTPLLDGCFKPPLQSLVLGGWPGSQGLRERLCTSSQSICPATGWMHARTLSLLPSMAAEMILSLSSAQGHSPAIPSSLPWIIDFVFPCSLLSVHLLMTLLRAPALFFPIYRTTAVFASLTSPFLFT